MIYLDHNATTPVLSDVFEAMRPYFCEEWGNPSSAYKFGSKLKSVVEAARAHAAERRLLPALHRQPSTPTPPFPPLIQGGQQERNVFGEMECV